jgi:hypothetical protein
MTKKGIKGCPCLILLLLSILASFDYALAQWVPAQNLPKEQPPDGSAEGPGTVPPPALNWREVRFSDGSGSIRLPDGWKITFSEKGKVAAMGPHGMVERGIWIQARTRASEAQQNAQYASYGLPPLRWPGLLADPTDPVSALQAYISYMNAIPQRRGRPPANIIRVNEVAPFQAPGFPQSAYIDLESEQGGTRYRGIQMVMLGPVNMEGLWLFYTSYASTRAESFAQNLPILIKIWGSIRTDQRFIDQSLKEALHSLREAGDIWKHSMEKRETAEDKWHNKRRELYQPGEDE